ncbi:Fcf2 pre-rRNA processing protein [Zea mays]|uniref:Fcf2 pre-rRNA processing protein n=1 Tax=Zea mays TaxID=4577 RepID=A0A1D6GLS7_MAIZE|nr:Fcf2 pre-rRNA processing protein [Zea mays]AQK64269.1 Fcf2 pre-rRNA processing protein [Zea mays]AQK64271.1 Fcf2 pre-rRNA processing protein [Zea mays]
MPPTPTRRRAKPALTSGQIYLPVWCCAYDHLVKMLQQAYAQMDGFDQTVNVKVVMATNRAHTLDSTLLRPVSDVPVSTRLLRHIIDLKRHFKRVGKFKVVLKYFQVGTVVEPASEFYSSRLKNRERKATLVDELLSDQSLKSYRVIHVGGRLG